MKGMANRAKGGALRARRTQSGRRANAIWPTLADEDQSDFEIVSGGMYGTKVDVSDDWGGGGPSCQTFKLGAR